MSTYPPHELSCSSAPVCRRLYDTITRLHAEIAEQRISNSRLKAENERLQFVESEFHNIDDVVEIARLSQRLKEHEEHLSATVSVPVLETHDNPKEVTP